MLSQSVLQKLDNNEQKLIKKRKSLCTKGWLRKVKMLKVLLTAGDNIKKAGKATKKALELKVKLIILAINSKAFLGYLT